jgi:hypothetical protein
VSPGTLEADVEQAALDLFTSLGWDSANVYEETLGEHGTLKGLETPVDISEVMEKVERLLDDSIDAAGYVIRERPGAPFGGRGHLGGHWFSRTVMETGTATRS